MVYSSENSATVVNNVNVSAESSGGQSTTQTNITTTTNGKTVHIESTEQGEIRVETKNGETKVQTSPGMKVNVSEGDAKVENLSTKSAEEKKTELDKNMQLKQEEIKKALTAKETEIKKTFWQQLENFFKDFFARFKN